MTMESTHRVLGHSLLRSLATLTLLLAPHCSLCSRAPLRSFVRSLALSLSPELLGKRFMAMEWMRRFHIISTHCAMIPRPFFVWISTLFWRRLKICGHFWRRNWRAWTENCRSNAVCTKRPTTASAKKIFHGGLKPKKRCLPREDDEKKITTLGSCLRVEYG